MQPRSQHNPSQDGAYDLVRPSAQALESDRPGFRHILTSYLTSVGLTPPL